MSNVHRNSGVPTSCGKIFSKCSMVTRFVSSSYTNQMNFQNLKCINSDKIHCNYELIALTTILDRLMTISHLVTILLYQLYCRKSLSLSDTGSVQISRLYIYLYHSHITDTQRVNVLHTFACLADRPLASVHK